MTIGTSNVLTGPVLDTADARIFLGDGNGYLYAVNSPAPAKTTFARVTIGWVGHGPGTGILAFVNDRQSSCCKQTEYDRQQESSRHARDRASLERAWGLLSVEWQAVPL